MIVVTLRPAQNPPLGYEYQDGALVPALEAARRRAADRPGFEPIRIALGLALAQATVEIAQLRRRLRTARRVVVLTIAVAIVALVAALTPARAATPTASAAVSARISVERIGACGSGGVVVGDGCSTRPADGLGYGQGMVGGVNSQDIADLKGWLTFPTPVTTVWFTVQDAFDQIYTTDFKVAIGGHRYEITRRQANGARKTFLVRLGRAASHVAIRIRNLGAGGRPTSNDGYSFRAAGACQ